MRNLFIDTASSRIILAILENDKIVYEKNVENDMNLSTRIFPLIDEMFQKSNTQPVDIDRIYVVNGPGSFTGVRIGVTIAKTMAWTLHKEIVSLSELELMATTSVEQTYKIPYIDARREAVFAAIYDKNNNILLNEQYISIEELCKLIPDIDDAVFLGYTPIHVDGIMEEPNVDLSMLIERHQNDRSLNPHEVNPNYLKRTEAEEKLEKSLHD